MSPCSHRFGREDAHTYQCSRCGTHVGLDEYERVMRRSGRLPTRRQTTLNAKGRRVVGDGR